MSDTSPQDFPPDAMIYANANDVHKIVSEAMRRHAQEAVMKERKEAWEAVQKWITPGDLQGNGCDQTAQRNGMILAANILAERFMKGAP